MEQLRQVGEVLGSLKALMVFRDEIRINQRQCCLLADVSNLAFEVIAEEIRQNLKFDEKGMKWKNLENPLRELQRILREGEQFIRQCAEPKDLWAKALSMHQNTDCVDFHLHNLLWCIPVVLEAIETVGEISGCDQEVIHKKRIIYSKKYEKEWMDPKLFQHKFGMQYLVSQEICHRMDNVSKEDRWLFSEMVTEKRNSVSSPITKQENNIAELLIGSKGKMFPTSVLVGSKEYQVRRRLGSGTDYKEVQWMGESFALRHVFGEVEPLRHEISLLSSLMHTNVMNVKYAFSDEVKKECFLLMELMSKDLSNYIKEICCARRRIPFPLQVAVDIMLQIARGMEYLHSHNMYHGELNPSNILVKSRNSPDGYLHVKITGFGFSALKHLKSSSNQKDVNPCIWYAPEVLVDQDQTSGTSSHSKYTEKADVYSFAMICFELLTGKIPFEDSHLQGEKMSRNIRAGERPLFPFPSPKYLTNLTKRCWHTNPNVRPSFSCICRVLLYIKRFLVLNPDQGIPGPAPPMDFFDLDMSLSKIFKTKTTTGTMKVSEIPFQMFAYRVIEREKTSMNIKDKSSDSGSEGTPIGSEEAGFGMNINDDSFSSLDVLKQSSNISSETNKKSFVRKLESKSRTSSGNGLQLFFVFVLPLMIQIEPWCWNR
ncbi:putative dual-specificity kinase TKL-Gdt family [Dioscorea sansibarensis]